MLSKTLTTLARLLTASIAASMLAGCGNKLDGVYSGRNTGFFEKMDFTSGDKVEITFMGMTKEGTYVVDGKKVKITVGAETSIFAIDDKGCLDGGGLIGKYCKGEGGAVANDDAVKGRSKKSDAAKSTASADGVRGIYKAGDGNGAMTLDFQTDSKVRITMKEAGKPADSADGSYALKGDRVTISMGGGQPLTLRRKNDGLEGPIEGHQLKFVKQ